MIFSPYIIEVEGQPRIDTLGLGDKPDIKEALPPPPPLPPELVPEILAVIGRLKFVFARTMPENPHEYTIRAKDDEAAAAVFGRLYTWIGELGRVERWGKNRYRYLYPGDGWRYWILGPRYSYIINRARTPDQEVADEQLPGQDGSRSGD